jgi:hypothetical protein
MLADQTDSAETLSHLGILLLDQALGPDATHTVITDAASCPSSVVALGRSTTPGSQPAALLPTCRSRHSM